MSENLFVEATRKLEALNEHDSPEKEYMKLFLDYSHRFSNAFELFEFYEFYDDLLFKYFSNRSEQGRYNEIGIHAFEWILKFYASVRPGIKRNVWSPYQFNQNNCTFRAKINCMDIIFDFSSMSKYYSSFKENLNWYIISKRDPKFQNKVNFQSELEKKYSDELIRKFEGEYSEPNVFHKRSALFKVMYISGVVEVSFSTAPTLSHQVVIYQNEKNLMVLDSLYGDKFSDSLISCVRPYLLTFNFYITLKKLYPKVSNKYKSLIEQSSKKINNRVNEILMNNLKKRKT